MAASSSMTCPGTILRGHHRIRKKILPTTILGPGEREVPFRSDVTIVGTGWVSSQRPLRLAIAAQDIEADALYPFHWQMAAGYAAISQVVQGRETCSYS